MYPFLQLDDGTEIVHSEMLPDGTVRVYLEKPDEKDCFHSASCILPQYRWADVSGFTEAEIGHYQQVIESVSHLIMEFSQCGGFDHAADF